MERITKGLLVLSLLSMALFVSTEGGRDVPNPPREEVYNPRNFWGLGPFGGGLGWGHGGLGLGGILPLIGGLPFLGGGQGQGIGGGLPGLGGQGQGIGGGPGGLPGLGGQGQGVGGGPGGLPGLGGLEGESKSSAKNDVVSGGDGIGKMMEPAPSATHN